MRRSTKAVALIEKEHAGQKNYLDLPAKDLLDALEKEAIYQAPVATQPHVGARMRHCIVPDWPSCAIIMNYILSQLILSIRKNHERYCTSNPQA